MLREIEAELARHAERIRAAKEYLRLLEEQKREMEEWMAKARQAEAGR